MPQPFFCASLPLSVVSTSGEATGSSKDFLSREEPTLLWRSSAAGNVYVIVQAGSADTVALLFSNLRATDTIRVRAGTTADNTSGSPTYDSGVLPAFSGNKAAICRTKSIVQLATANAGPFWRIDVAAPSHPDGYVTAARVLVGNRIELPVDWGCKQGVSDPSVAVSGNGWTDYQSFTSLPTWEWTSSWISDANWTDRVWPYLMTVGNKTPILFVPDMNGGRIQNQAVYGRITTGPLAATSTYVDMWGVTMALTGLTS